MNRENPLASPPRHSSSFPPQIFITLEQDEDGSETLCAAFDPEDCSSGEIGVYELRSVGRNESRFVENVENVENKSTALEQRAVPTGPDSGRLVPPSVM